MGMHEGSFFYLDLNNMFEMSTTKEWLNEKLVESVLGDGRRVKDVRISPGSAVGDNYMGEIHRISAVAKSENDEDEEISLIVKCVPQTSVMQEIISTWDTFGKEYHTLSKVLPNMFALLDAVSPGKFEFFGAHCYYRGLSPTSFLVLEDLRPQGFKLANRHQGLDLDHCKLVLTRLARFHASSIALHKKDPRLVESVRGGIFCEESRKCLDNYCKGGLTCLVKMLREWEGPYKNYADDIEAMIDTFFDAVMKLCQPKENEFKVLTHSDLWMNNIMFKYSDTDVVDVRFIDYQASTYGSPAIDLQLFIYTSMSDETRSLYLEVLMATYFSELSNMLDLLDCKEEKISYERFLQEFDAYTLYGLFAAGCELPVALREHGQEYNIDASFSSFDDDGRNRELYSNDRYVRRIRKILPIFQEKGLFSK